MKVFKLGRPSLFITLNKRLWSLRPSWNPKLWPLYWNLYMKESILPGWWVFHLVTGFSWEASPIRDVFFTLVVSGRVMTGSNASYYVYIELYRHEWLIDWQHQMTESAVIKRNYRNYKFCYTKLLFSESTNVINFCMCCYILRTFAISCLWWFAVHGTPLRTSNALFFFFVYVPWTVINK